MIVADILETAFISDLEVVQSHLDHALQRLQDTLVHGLLQHLVCTRRQGHELTSLQFVRVGQFGRHPHKQTIYSAKSLALVSTSLLINASLCGESK